MGTDETLCNHIFLFSPAKSRLSFPLLPANPLLIPPRPVTSVPSLNLPLGALQVEQTQTPSPMVIVAEGMPPIQTKLRDMPLGVCRSLKIIRGLRPSTG